ncbi:hypothetical protein [Thalassotalea maritima]|uniref:hypothetical protein n=1 Tax=Thalassotalea maritima TaxID=3242416 RepID=UPI0035295232
MSEQDKQRLFECWLDGQISPEQSEQLERLASDDEQLAQRLMTARLAEQQAFCYAEQSVPKWDKSATFDTEHKPWWQWQGLPVASMAMSIFAIGLVLFNVKVSQTEQGLTIAFGHSQQALPNDIETLVDQRLIDFAKEQQLVMAAFNQDIVDRQQDNNLKLATYVLSASRAERQQDISDVVSFVNQSRGEDNLNQTLRLQQLQYKIQTQAITPSLEVNKENDYE